MWEVYRNNKSIGIIVSNYAWEKPYWDQRSLITEDKFELVRI